MVPKPDDITLPESIPNPSFGPLVDHGNVGGGVGNGNGNGNGMKMRVPMERRCVKSL